MGITSYKIGDKYGFEEGQRYGYGLDCRDDLEYVKNNTLKDLEMSLEFVRQAAVKLDTQKRSDEELLRAHWYNELRPKMLKASLDNVLLNAITEYDDKGEPKFDEGYQVSCRSQPVYRLQGKIVYVWMLVGKFYFQVGLDGVLIVTNS